MSRYHIQCADRLYNGEAGACDQCDAMYDADVAENTTQTLQSAPPCELCGEPLDGRGNGTAEMYDPSGIDLRDSVTCHADCGLARGMEIA